MAEKNLSIKLSLNDKQFQSNLKKSMRSLKKFGNSMKRTGQTLSRNLTLPLAAFGTASLIAFDKQEKAIAQVEAGLKSTGMAAGFTSKELQKMASDLQAKTLFGDEDILQNATAQLLTFTNIAGEQFEKTQIAVTNLATKSFKGDLKSASIQLGKALNDPIANLSALSRAGIQFSDEQKETIRTLVETNRLADAQNLILKELETQFGGSAEAAAQAGLGGFQQLQNTLGDLAEDFGAIIYEFLPPLKKGLEKIVGVVKSLTKEQKENLVKWGGLLAIIGPILAVLGSFITSLATIIPLFIKGAAVVGTFVAAMNPLVGIGVAVAGGLTYIASKMGLFTKETKDANSELSKLEDHSLVIAPQQTTPTPTGGGQRRSSIPERIEPIKVLSVELNKVADGFDNATRKAEGLSNVLSNQEQFTLNLTSKFESFGNTIQGVLAQSLQSSEGFFKSFIDGTKQAIKGLMSQIAAMVLMQGILSAFGFGSIGLASESLGKGLGGILGKLPFFENGGLVSGATIGMVGEGRNISMSNPEVIAPLDKLKSMIGTGMGAVEVYGSISGQDILLSSDRARNNRNRTRGY